MVASLQGLRSRQRCSHTDISTNTGKKTHLLKGSLHILREDNKLRKIVTTSFRDLQAVPDNLALKSLSLPYALHINRSLF